METGVFMVPRGGASSAPIFCALHKYKVPPPIRTSPPIRHSNPKMSLTLTVVGSLRVVLHYRKTTARVVTGRSDACAMS